MNTPQDKNFKVIFENTAEDVHPKNIYVDGVQGIMLSPSVTRIQMYDVVDNSNNVETRRVNTSIVIPTHALIEFCANFLAGAAVAKDQISIATHTQLDKMIKQLEILKTESLSTESSSTSK